MEQICREFGPPKELLCDNGPSFRAYVFARACEAWGIAIRYRCAYRPQGNGIVERHHRTIKRMAARSQGDPLMMVYYYNLAPLSSGDSATAPSNQLFHKPWRLCGQRITHDNIDVEAKYQVGDRVFVKPMDNRCTSVWSRGVVTAVNSETNISVNSIPRHVNDLRHIPQVNDEDATNALLSSETEDSGDETVPAIDDEHVMNAARPRRVVRYPPRLAVYDTYIFCSDFLNHAGM